MERFDVRVSLECNYVIEAENKESACEKVRKYLSEREPNFEILEVKKYENE